MLADYEGSVLVRINLIAKHRFLNDLRDILELIISKPLLVLQNRDHILALLRNLTKRGGRSLGFLLDDLIRHDGLLQSPKVGLQNIVRGSLLPLKPTLEPILLAFLPKQFQRDTLKGDHVLLTHCPRATQNTPSLEGLEVQSGQITFGDRRCGKGMLHISTRTKLHRSVLAGLGQKHLNHQLSAI